MSFSIGKINVQSRHLHHMMVGRSAHYASLKAEPLRFTHFVTSWSLNHPSPGLLSTDTWQVLYRYLFTCAGRAAGELGWLGVCCLPWPEFGPRPGWVGRSEGSSIRHFNDTQKSCFMKFKRAIPSFSRCCYSCLQWHQALLSHNSGPRCSSDSLSRASDVGPTTNSGLGEGSDRVREPHLIKI